MAAAKITVERRRRYVGSASAFRVMLDGIEQGRLRPGDQLTFEAMPGAHQVYVTTDGRVRSRPIEFDLSPGQHAQILSSSPGNPVGNLYRIFFQPGETLEIELAGRQGSQQLGERQDG